MTKRRLSFVISLVSVSCLLGCPNPRIVDCDTIRFRGEVIDSLCDRACDGRFLYVNLDANFQLEWFVEYQCRDCCVETATEGSLTADLPASAIEELSKVWPDDTIAVEYQLDETETIPSDNED